MRQIGPLVLAAAVATMLAGCTPGPGTGGAGTPPPTLYPRWVRIGPVSTARVSYYVGLAVGPLSAEEAVAAARADALEDIEGESHRRFRRIFDMALADARETTVPSDRSHFINAGGASYYNRMAAAASQDSVYLRSCPGEETSKEICQAYVLLAIEGSMWDRLLAETAESLRRDARDVGDTELADVAERMYRMLEDAGAGEPAR
jgi:hypothetical protein